MAVPPPTPSSVGPMLLERERELARLTKLVAAARDGAGAVAVVEGPPGIGKTELLKTLATRADKDGMRVLSARGDELERGFAFGVTRQLFERVVDRLPVTERAELFTGAALLAQRVVDPGSVPATSDAPADAFQLVHGLYWLTANLAEQRPVAVVVDDAHWADRPSLRWLHYLSRRLEGVGVLVVVATRSTEPEAPIDEIEAVKAAAEAELLRPAPLSEPATGVLLGAVFDAEPAPALVQEAHRVTGGNPFLLSELAQTLSADGMAPDAAAAERLGSVTPATIVRSTLGRLARLSEEARRLARAAALLGEDAHVRHAGALAGLDESEALAAADHLTAAGFVEAGAEAAQLRFSHPLVRQALADDVPAGERAALRKQAARLLAAEAGTAERAAAHLLHTAPAGDSWVVAVLRRTAAVASSRGSPDAAVAYLRRALDEPPAGDCRSQVLLELGQAEAHALDPNAIGHLEEAASVSSDAGERLSALGTLSFAQFLQGDDPRAFRTAREALELIPPGTGGEAEAELLVTCCWSGRPEPEVMRESTILLEQSRSGRRGEPTPAELVRITWQAHHALLGGRRRHAAELLTWVAARPAELFDAVPAATALALGLTQAFCGLAGDAEATLARVVDHARRHGNALYRSSGLAALVYLLWRRGDLPRAIAQAETLLGRVLQSGEDPAAQAATWTRVTWALCLLEQGDALQARGVLDLPGQGQVRLPGWMRLWVPYAQGWLALAEGDVAEARRDALEAGERLRAIEVTSPDFIPWRSLAAQAMARDGDHDQGLALAHEELSLARQEGSPRATGIALTTIGTLEPSDAGLDALQEAVAVLDGEPDRLEHARALCGYGAALRRANRRTDARGPLEQAIALARACGAFPLAERSHAELRATGARPRRLVFTGVESLTPRERQVAELAAEGRSNPEIAQALFVTRKTVETHLGAVYRKLEIDSRDRLADVLAAQGR